MTTLNELGFNFKTTENAFKTIGTLVIILLGIAIVINTIINPNAFIL